MQLWTSEHFLTIVPAVMLMILVTYYLNKLLKDKPYETRMIPFKVLAIILLLSEVIKQVKSFINGYDLYHIPLHVCSLFILLIPLMAFYRGKHKEIIRTMTCTVCLSLMLFMTVYPNLIYSAGNITNFFKNYFDFHTVFFHNGVIFAFILIIGLNLHSIDNKKYDKYILIYSAIYACTAALMAQLLKTNFSNFYTCNVGPVYDFVNKIKEAIGYFAGQSIYVIIMIILHIAFFYGTYKLYVIIDNYIRKLNNKIKAINKVK